LMLFFMSAYYHGHICVAAIVKIVHISGDS